MNFKKVRPISTLVVCLILTINVVYAGNLNTSNYKIDNLDLNSEFLKEESNIYDITNKSNLNNNLDIKINKKSGEGTLNENGQISVDITGNITISNQEFAFSTNTQLYKETIENDNFIFGSVRTKAFNESKEIPIGLFIHYIPSQNKEMVSVTIGEGEESEVYIFGESFEQTNLIKDILESKISEQIKKEELNNTSIMSSSTDQELKDTTSLMYNGTEVGFFSLSGEKGLDAGNNHTAWTLVKSNRSNFLDKYRELHSGDYSFATPDYVYNRVIFPADDWDHDDSSPDPGANETISVFDPFYLGIININVGTTVSKYKESYNGSIYDNSTVFEQSKLWGWSSEEMDMSDSKNGIPTKTRMLYKKSDVRDHAVIAHAKIGYTIERVFGSGNTTYVTWTSPTSFGAYEFESSIW